VHILKPIYALNHLMSLSLLQIEKISKALGDLNRLRIVKYIDKKGGRLPCSDIKDIVDLTQPSISHHIKMLLNVGLIEREKEGRNHIYHLNVKLVKAYSDALIHLKSS
jgi:ArsR family transcriptional regulator